MQLNFSHPITLSLKGGAMAIDASFSVEGCCNEFMSLLAKASLSGASESYDMASILDLEKCHISGLDEVVTHAERAANGSIILWLTASDQTHSNVLFESNRINSRAFVTRQT